MNRLRLHRAVIIVIAVFVLGITSVAQTVATGTPDFGSFAGGPDVINLGNLNAHYGFPVFGKPGRGLPFSYTLGYDSSVWRPVGSVGYQTWQPASNWGWAGTAMGYVYYTTTTQRCWVGMGYPGGPNGQWVYANIYNFVAYYDQTGVAHPINTTVYAYVSQCPITSPTSVSGVNPNDGSGYTIDVNNTPSATVHARDGSVINAPLTSSSSGVITDRNGNNISASSSGVLTDTLGRTALSITGSGTPTSPGYYTYTDSNGASQKITVNYSTFTVKTAFGCSGVSEYGPTSVNLVSSIVYPDTTSYQFTYEATPGYAGYVTGRVDTVTLPTGGTIHYGYFNGNNGIVCSDGSTAAMHRTTTDGDTVYGRAAVTSTSWTTTIDPPDHNQAVISFQQNTGTGNFYETQRKSYSGTAATGTLISTVDTCYNGAARPCTGSAITLYINSTDVTTTLANNYVADTVTSFNSNGLPTGVVNYDFASGARGGILRNTQITYAAVGNGILNRPAQVTVYDGSNAIQAQSTYVYDAKGNATSITKLLSGGTNPVTTMAYDSYGNLTSTTDPGGHTTTFTYSTTFASAYLTQVTLPNTGVAHTTSANYDVNTGLKLSDTDQNGKITTYTYDSMLRPLKVTRPDTGHTDYIYSSYNGNLYSQAQDYMNASTNVNHWILYDGYGRPSRSFMVNGEGDADQQDTCYDTMGRVGFVSYPYHAGGLASTKVCSGAGDSYSYSYVGTTATATVTHSDGTSTKTEVLARTTRVTDESSIQRLSMVDGLGRTAYVCEVTAVNQSGSNNVPGACYLDIAATGFRTDYDYDTLGNLRHTYQGAQTRTFNYDSLSRLTSTTVPESGTTSFTYDADGNTLTRVRPAPNQTGTATVTTNYGYDALNRLTSTSYSDGTTLPVYRYYDESSIYGATLTNTIGRLSRNVVSNSSTAYNLYTYDVMGRVLGNWQDTPSLLGSSKYLAYTYDLLGNVLTSTNGAGVTFTNAYNQASRLTSVSSSLSDTYHPASLLSNVHYGPFGPTTDNLGNGLTESRGYTARGQYSQLSVPGIYSFSLAFTANGNVSFSNDGVNGGIYYAYDDFNRLSVSNKPNIQTFNYQYDRYGNRWQQNVTTGSGLNPSYSFDSNNRITTAGFAYDAAGNMTNDTFHTYSYDAENRMISVDGGVTKYVYDADGRRIAKQNSSNVSTQEYLYDLAGHNVTTLNPGSGAGPYEVYAAGRHLATYARGVTYFAHADWVGTERVKSSYSGGISENCTSLPFGDALTCTGVDTNPSPDHFTGDEHDTESNTERTWFRQLSTTQGRWTSPDPLAGNIGNPQSLNRYAYVGNNPINYFDPLGLFQSTACMVGYTWDEGSRECVLPAGLDPIGTICIYFGCGPIWIPNVDDGGPPSLKRTSPTKASPALIHFLADCEGHRPNYGIYNDSNHHCTVGIGQFLHLGPCTDADSSAYPNGMSQDAAESEFAKRVEEAENDIAANTPDNLSQGQFDALVSLRFNMGPGGPGTDHGIRAHDVWGSVMAGNYAQVPADINTLRGGGTGIPYRRANEAQIFQSSTYSTSCYAHQ